MYFPSRCSTVPPENGSSWRQFPAGKFVLVLHFIAALLFLLPALAGAAPMYHYTYTGNPFGSGNPGFYRGPYTAEDFIFAEITTPTPLVAGDHNQMGTPGLGFLMGDGDHTLVYQTTFEPYYELLPQEFIDEWMSAPTEDVYLSYPYFPYIRISSPISYDGQIFIHELDAFGLPTAWYIHLGVHEQEDFRTFRGATISSRSGVAGYEDVDITDRGDSFSGWGYDHGSIYFNPGSWQLTVSEVMQVPEPPTVALLLLALGVLAGMGGAKAILGRAPRQRLPGQRPLPSGR